MKNLDRDYGEHEQSLMERGWMPVVYKQRQHDKRIWVAWRGYLKSERQVQLNTVVDLSILRVPWVYGKNIFVIDGVPHKTRVSTFFQGELGFYVEMKDYDSPLQVIERYFESVDARYYIEKLRKVPGGTSITDALFDFFFPSTNQRMYHF